MLFSRIGSYFIIPQQFAGTFVGSLVSSQFSKKVIKKARNDFKYKHQAQKVTIVTEDKIKLNGMLFQRQKYFFDYFKRSKIWICFNGQGVCYENISSEYIKKIQNLGFDILLFNYRGVAKSQGYPTAGGLIKDGKSVLQWAHLQSYHKKIVHGHSLGGLIAANAISQINGKNIYLISDRSISSIAAFVKYSFLRFLIFVTWIVCKVLKITNWNIKAKPAFNKIKNNSCVLYSPKDDFLPQKSFLYNKVKDSIDSKRIIKLPDSWGHRTILDEKIIKQALRVF